MGVLDPHPALKAIVPQASPADMWLGDDFHHNGAFRLSYGLEYAYMMESSKEMTDRRELIDRYDTYDWYLELGPLSNANARYFHESLPTWNDFVRHPDYDAFWKRQAFAPWLNRVTVPTLNVAGWWDQEDFYGPIKIYELLEKHDTRRQELSRRRTVESRRLVARRPAERSAASTSAAIPRRTTAATCMAPFLAHYLKDQGAPPASEAMTFRTGANEWAQHDAWPPTRQRHDRRLYFQADGKLSFDAPPATHARGIRRYVSDPAKPGAVSSAADHARVAAGRRGWSRISVSSTAPRRAHWATEPLTRTSSSRARSSRTCSPRRAGTDSDWIVKLIDVYPGEVRREPRRWAGYQLMIAGEVFRGRYRKSFEKPAPLDAERSVQYEIRSQPTTTRSSRAPHHGAGAEHAGSR